MINRFKAIFNKKNGPEDYKSLSDFFLHASTDAKKKVITEAARKSNEDQMKVFKQSKIKACNSI